MKKYLLFTILGCTLSKGMDIDCFEDSHFTPTFCCLTRDSNQRKVSKIKYTEKLVFGGNRIFGISSDIGKKLCLYCKERASKDNFKNHAFVRLYCSSIEKDSICWYNNSKNPGVITDWASKQSQLKSTPKIKVVCSDTERGHSEQMIIKCIEDDFRQGQLVSKFQTLFDKMKTDSSKEKYIIGFDICSSFDMCDVCKESMVSFFNQHRMGQTSIFQAVNDRLVSKNFEADKFIIKFQSQYPYKGATYSINLNSDLFANNKLAYDYNFHSCREDRFRISLDGSMGDIYLTQQTSTLAKSGIFGYIYELENSLILYDKGAFRHRHK